MAPARLGQNFLADGSWRARILSAIAPQPDETWIEIGAGHGEMTDLLAKRAGRVVAVELDSRLAARLRTRAAAWPNVVVVQGDILKLNLVDVDAASQFRIFGNIPYYITSPILHRIFDAAGCAAECAKPIVSVHLVMQLEVAERLVAQPGRREYGYLSVATQFHATPKILEKIPPGAFRPRPKVASALVELRFPGAVSNLKIHDASRFLRFVQTCFAQKRKTLANNLRGILFAAIHESRSGRAKPGNRVAAVGVAQKIVQLGIAPGARAEELTLNQFAALYDALNADWI